MGLIPFLSPISIVYQNVKSVQCHTQLIELFPKNRIYTKMKASKLFVLFGLAAAQSNTWDADGVKALCGMCKDNAPCDVTNGKCQTGGCQLGWTGEWCTEPQCNASCGEGGQCASPDNCVCGYLYANGEDGGCYSLRTDGVKGAFMALGVMMLSITFCGGLQTYLTKGQKPE